MENVLQLVNEGISHNELSDYTQNAINSTSGWYKNFETQVLEAYKITNLTYDAQINPFI
jgi:hypothetical protein